MTKQPITRFSLRNFAGLREMKDKKMRRCINTKQFKLGKKSKQKETVIKSLVLFWSFKSPCHGIPTSVPGIER